MEIFSPSYGNFQNDGVSQDSTGSASSSVSEGQEWTTNGTLDSPISAISSTIDDPDTLDKGADITDQPDVRLGQPETVEPPTRSRENKTKPSNASVRGSQSNSQTGDGNSVNRTFKDTSARLLINGSSLPPPPYQTKDLSRSHPQRKIIAWWWWEIGACLVSITCMSLLFSLLASINDTPLDDWHLAAQPSTIIAVLTTVAKTALLVPIAACIDQLKWRHYAQQQPRPIYDLQLFDEASRGPWGSTTVLWHIPRTRSLLVGALALCTVSALGLEPSAQQILQLSEKSMARDEVAYIGVANDYASAAVQNRRVITLDPKLSLAVQGAMVNAMRGMVLEPAFSCPQYAERCTYGNISTLGVCRDIDEIEIDCADPRDLPDDNCILSIADEHNLMGHVGKNTSSDPRITLVNTTFINDKDSSLLTFFLIEQGHAVEYPYPRKAGPYVDKVGTSEYVPAGYKAIQCRWYFCMQTYYGVKASPIGNITFDSLKERELEEVYDEESGEWQGHTAMDSTQVSSWIFPGGNWSLMDHLFLFGFDTAISWDVANGALEENDNIFTAIILDSNITELTANMAQAATNIIRNGGPGDNLMGEKANGTAHWTVIQFKVRWQWLLLPVIQTVVVYILLGITILVTLEQPLLKGSAVALLFHGLDGWQEEELSALLPVRENLGALDEVAKDIQVELAKNEQGVLKFRRVR